MGCALLSSILQRPRSWRGRCLLREEGEEGEGEGEGWEVEEVEKEVEKEVEEVGKDWKEEEDVEASAGRGDRVRVTASMAQLYLCMYQGKRNIGGYNSLPNRGFLANSLQNVELGVFLPWNTS